MIAESLLRLVVMFLAFQNACNEVNPHIHSCLLLLIQLLQIVCYRRLLGLMQTMISLWLKVISFSCISSCKAVSIDISTVIGVDNGVCIRLVLFYDRVDNFFLPDPPFDFPNFCCTQ